VADAVFDMTPYVAEVVAAFQGAFATATNAEVEEYVRRAGFVLVARSEAVLRTRIATAIEDTLAAFAGGIELRLAEPLMAALVDAIVAEVTSHD